MNTEKNHQVFSTEWVAGYAAALSALIWRSQETDAFNFLFTSLSSQFGLDPEKVCKCVEAMSRPKTEQEFTTQLVEAMQLELAEKQHSNPKISG